MVAVQECRFRESSAAWEEEYATAFCKLSSFGASFAPGKASIEGLFAGASQGCLSVTQALSLQQCSVCDLAHYDTITGVGGRAPPSAPVPATADFPTPAGLADSRAGSPVPVEFVEVCSSRSAANVIKVWLENRSVCFYRCPRSDGTHTGSSCLVFESGLGNCAPGSP